MLRIRSAATEIEIARCVPVLHQLRPMLTQEALTAAIVRMQHDGYRLAYLEEAGVVHAVAGYRVIEMLRTAQWQGMHIFGYHFSIDCVERSDALGTMASN